MQEVPKNLHAERQKTIIRLLFKEKNYTKVIHKINYIQNKLEIIHQ